MIPVESCRLTIFDEDGGNWKEIQAVLNAKRRGQARVRSRRRSRGERRSCPGEASKMRMWWYPCRCC